MQPAFGMIPPGESETVTVRVRVSTDTVRGLASALGSGDLDDILILKLERGREFYISVGIQYLRSCFGMSLAELVRTHDSVRASAARLAALAQQQVDAERAARAMLRAPLRAVTGADSSESSMTGPNLPPVVGDTPPALPVPKELWRIVDFIAAK